MIYVALILIAGWLLALELRHHSLKGVVAESKEMASDALAAVRERVAPKRTSK